MKLTPMLQTITLGKRFAKRRPALLRTKLTSLFSKKSESEYFWALRNITLTARAGEIVIVNGTNGIGKTTLLRLIAGTLRPTEGRVVCGVKPDVLIQPVRAFHNELPVKDAVILLGRLFGWEKSAVRKSADEILEFAGLRDCLDRETQTLSTGMQTRLYFSLLVHRVPKLFIVDELLATLDMEFMRRCTEKLQSLSKSGSAILAISQGGSALDTIATRSVSLSAQLSLARAA